MVQKRSDNRGFNYTSQIVDSEVALTQFPILKEKGFLSNTFRINKITLNENFLGISGENTRCPEDRIIRAEPDAKGWKTQKVFILLHDGSHVFQDFIRQSLIAFIGYQDFSANDIKKILIISEIVWDNPKLTPDYSLMVCDISSTQAPLIERELARV